MNESCEKLACFQNSKAMYTRSANFGDFMQLITVVLLPKFQDNLSLASSRVKQSKQLKHHSLNTTDKVEIVEAYNTYRRDKKLTKN